MAVFWGGRSLVNIINYLSKGGMSKSVFAALTKCMFCTKYHALADLHIKK